MIEQNKEIETWAREGYLYVTVYHSHDKKPIRQRVVLKEFKVR